MFEWEEMAAVIHVEIVFIIQSSGFEDVLPQATLPSAIPTLAYILGQDLSLNQELTNLAILAGQLAPEICLSAS